MENHVIQGEEFYKKKETLKKLKVDNWVIYYLDETTGEKWIEEYPFSEMQGGGPPQLRLIDKFPWDLDGGNFGAKQ